MKKYEIMFIFETEDEKFKKVQESIGTIFSNNKVKISNEKNIGQKDLAYPINNINRGHYYLYNIEADPNVILEVEKAFKLTKGLMRYLVIKKDK